MINWVIVAILALILGTVGCYLYRAKKRGETCIGCPYAKQCSSRKCSGKQHSCSEQSNDRSL